MNLGMQSPSTTIEILARYDRDSRLMRKSESVVGSISSILVLPRAANPLAPQVSLGTTDRPEAASMAATLVVRVENSLSPEVTIRLRVPRLLKRFVRLIQHEGGEWIDLGALGEWTVTVDSFQADQGVPIIVLSECFARPARHRVAGWDGNFSITASLVNSSGTVIARDKIACQVTPFIIPSSLDPVEQVKVVDTRISNRFVEHLSKELNQIGESFHPWHFQEAIASDVWAQDTALFGVAALPGPFGTDQFLAMMSGLRGLHSGISTEPLDHNVRHQYITDNAIVVDPAEPRQDTRWIDWYGNFEVSPPVVSEAGQRFPYGRILYGRQNDLSFHHDVLGFLEAQKVQWPPLEVDVSWLTIGHVDEVVNFVPCATDCGFKLLFPSVDSAKTILYELISDGYADTVIFRNKAEKTTVKRLYDEVALSAETFKIATALHRQKRELMAELGIHEDDIIELPALFRDGLPVIPNPINSLVIGSTIIVPDPLGPIVNSIDRFKQAIRSPLSIAGMNVRFIDVWEPYHVRSGEIHCATNTIRSLMWPNWWEHLSQ